METISRPQLTIYNSTKPYILIMPFRFSGNNVSSRLIFMTVNSSETKALSKELFAIHVQPNIEMLLRAARHMANNPADTQDLVQETLLKAFKAIGKFDGKYPKAWLLTILRNTAITLTTKRRPELLTGEIFENSEIVSGFQMTDPQIDDEFSFETLKAFNALNENAKVVLTLIDIEGFSYAEVSALLDIPQGTVMSRVHRGRNDIKKALERKGIKSSKEIL